MVPRLPYVRGWISTGFPYACSGSMHTIPVPLVAVTPFYKNSVPHANEQGAVTIVHCIPGTNYISKLTSKERRTSIHSSKSYKRRSINQAVYVLSLQNTSRELFPLRICTYAGNLHSRNALVMVIPTPFLIEIMSSSKSRGT